jgi:hypothetical protein
MYNPTAVTALKFNGGTLKHAFGENLTRLVDVSRACEVSSKAGYMSVWTLFKLYSCHI